VKFKITKTLMINLHNVYLKDVCWC